MRHIGTVLLGVWLILQGLIPLLGLHFRGIEVVMAALAIVAGIMLLVRR